MDFLAISGYFFALLVGISLGLVGSGGSILTVPILVYLLGFDAITATAFPSADLCIIRQVLQHLSNQQILEILEKTKVFKYVMITEHIPLNPQVINANKSTGGYIRLQNKAISGVYLDRPPFNQAIKTLLSYPQNDKNYDGKIVPAIMQTVLIENDIKA